MPFLPYHRILVALMRFFGSGCIPFFFSLFDFLATLFFSMNTPLRRFGDRQPLPVFSEPPPPSPPQIAVCSAVICFGLVAPRSLVPSVGRVAFGPSYVQDRRMTCFWGVVPTDPPIVIRIVFSVIGLEREGFPFTNPPGP